MSKDKCWKCGKVKEGILVDTDDGGFFFCNECLPPEIHYMDREVKNDKPKE